MGKNILLFGLTIIILIGVCGCMTNQNELSVNEQVEKYMKDKYNEDFKVVGGGTEGWNAPDTEIYVRSERFPDVNIMVRRGKKTGEMIDNYVSYLMKDKIEEVMTEIVSPIYSTSKVIYRTERAPQRSATPQMSVDEYIKYCSENMGISLAICINDPDYKTNKDEKLEELRKKLEEKQCKVDLTIFYVIDGKLDLINDSNINDLYRGATEADWLLMRGDFTIDESYKLEYSEWRKIK
ncbi:hypothetical protein EHE19_004965 [Ruminiclostridium herbifermentans]|uniref:Lipoprotein n=2 Tax=Ruminiclostridium herbifermentans TaxID=2488810 RepID=A0A4U7JEY0_9FIRM|nr:hypothetical protein EHE19_004965 [Ruminiclostridium herbifermentans]